MPLIAFELVGVTWGPFDEDGSFRDALPIIWTILLTLPVGAAFGWALTRQAWPAVAFAVATLTVDLVMGGGIASSGGRGVILGLFFWLLPTYLLAGAAGVGVQALLGPRAGESA